MAGPIVRITARHAYQEYVFGQDAVAAAQTDVQLPAVGPEEGGTVDGYAMAFDFEIVSVTAALSAAGSAGTLSVGATIDGTEDADTTLAITTGTNHSKKVQRGAAVGTAGQRLGCELTTDGSWNGTTADIVVCIGVLLKLDGI